MAENIPCMLISLKDDYLLLPSSSIIEIITMPPLNPMANNAPVFFLGLYQWQNVSVPVIDFESLVTHAPPKLSEAHDLCLVHGINASVKMSVYGLACYSAPHLIQVDESTLTLAKDTVGAKFVHFQIQVGSKFAYLPDLDEIEVEMGRF